jgi:GNAT superfamily N-acetyltransferase
MPIEIEEIDPTQLERYGQVPSRYLVRTILQAELDTGGLGGIRLRQVPVPEPYEKDYDSYGELPTDWPSKFDVSRWGFFLAHAGQEPVAAAAVAFSTPGVFMLEERQDLAVLWDLRVRPQARGAGIPLFRHAARWARARGGRQLKIETQNVNVPACRFYQRMGAQLGEIRRFGYAAVPAVAHEIMLCWYLDL